MNEKKDVIQIIGSLMKKPSLLSQTDKVYLSISDFSTNFERYLFDCIEVVVLTMEQIKLASST